MQKNYYLPRMQIPLLQILDKGNLISHFFLAQALFYLACYPLLFGVSNGPYNSKIDIVAHGKNSSIITLGNSCTADNVNESQKENIRKNYFRWFLPTCATTVVHLPLLLMFLHIYFTKMFSQAK